MCGSEMAGERRICASQACLARDKLGVVPMRNEQINMSVDPIMHTSWHMYMYDSCDELRCGDDLGLSANSFDTLLGSQWRRLMCAWTWTRHVPLKGKLHKRNSVGY